jgi:hypothetical protein
MPKIRSKHQQRVIESCLAHAETLAVPQRALLYTALAEVCGDTQEAACLLTLARQLQQTDQSCREFRFDFSASALGAEIQRERDRD